MNSLEFQSKLREAAGSKYQDVMSLIREFGIEVLTKVSSVDAEIGSLKIRSIDQSQKPSHIRRFQFKCEIDGKHIDEIRRIELDPIDYTDGDLFMARITLNPIIKESTDEGSRSG